MRPAEMYSRQFPERHACKVIIRLKNGDVFTREKMDFEAMGWETVTEKFEQLSESHAAPALRKQIIETVQKLETLPVRALTRLLAEVSLEPKER